MTNRRRNLGFILNTEIKEQSMHWMQTNSPNKQKRCKQRLSACQKADGICFLREDMSADCQIHATRDQINARRVLQNTKEIA
jgi:hypothetical protein